MKTIITLVGMFCLFATPVPGAGENPSPDKTLSPYFFVESEDATLEHFPLKNTEVEVSISGVIAEITVTQRYINNGAEAINGSYIFPGSTRAAVHGMKMRIGERVITAKIKEKKEAKKIFDKARNEGKRASLLEQKRPNVFSMQVANIMPGDTLDIELRYTELLVPENGVYEFVYPTVVGPRYRSSADVSDETDQGWVNNPYLKKGSRPRTEFFLSAHLDAGMPIQDISCPSHETKITFKGQTEVDIIPDASSEFGGNRDYILRYRLAGKKIAAGLLLQKGDVENHFLLMVQPPLRTTPKLIPAREYIFIVDVSGSMNGFPLDVSKRLMRGLLGGLRPVDSFNVLLFAGSSHFLSDHSVQATPEWISRAEQFVGSSRGGGGTELLKALNRAYDAPRREGVARSAVILTDGYISAERAVFEKIQLNLHHTNVFAFGIGSSVNRYLIEGMAKSGQGEPFVVTDAGEAPEIARRFGTYISQPVLTDIKLSFKGFEAYDIEPPAIADLFAERPITVFGKWRGEAHGSVVVTGRSGEGAYIKEFQLDELAAQGQSNPAGLPYLWARSRLGRLSDFRSDKADPARRAEIVDLGLTYNLLSAYTSFVAVDEVVANPGGDARHVKQPLPLPKGVSNLAVGGMQSVDEPDLSIVALLGLVTAVTLALMRRKSLRGVNVV